MMPSQQGAHYTSQRQATESFGPYEKQKIWQRKQICHQCLLSAVAARAILSLLAVWPLSQITGRKSVPALSGSRRERPKTQQQDKGTPREAGDLKTAQGCARAGTRQSLEVRLRHSQPEVVMQKRGRGPVSSVSLHLHLLIHLKCTGREKTASLQ